VHKTKRETDELVAAYFPRPAAPVLVRRLPAAVPAPASPAAGLGPALATAVVGSVAATRVVGSAAAPAAACPEPAAAALGPAAPPVPATWMATPAPAPWTAPPARPPAAVTPLGAERYKVQFTAPRSLRDKLKEAQDLLGHAVPPGDVAAVFERALDTLLKDLRRKKHGEAMAPRPRPAARRRAGWTRHLPRATRREVAARDERRCAYVDPATGKRCSATTGLEFHHLEPWARGGSDEPSNVVLACRAHNGLAAERDFGASFMARRIGSVRATGARPGETAGGPPAAVCAGSPPPVGRAGEPGLAGRAGGPGLAGRAGKPGLAGRAGGPGLAGRAGGPGLAGRAGGPLPGVRRDGLLPAGRAGGPPPEVRRDGLLPAGRAGGPGSAGRAGEGRGQPDAVTGSGGSPARMAATALEARAAGAAGPDG
jgi:5-methylcytosine-specific restriction endonuclease McrA